MSWCERTPCSVWTRTLTFFPALSETTEICGTIPTEGRWGIKGRKLGGDGDGDGSGGGAGSDSRTNGERGDFWKAGGRVEWEGMICGTRLRACGLHTIPSDGRYSSAFGPSYFPFTLSLLHFPSPPNELSLVCGLSSLVNLSRHSP